MADKSVRVVLSANVGGYKSAMEQAAASTGKVVSATDKLAQQKGFEHLGRAAVLGSVAAVGAIGAMVGKFAEFDEVMSQVGAATGASAADLDKLRKAAMDAGAEFGQFSSTEAAGAIEELGKAGLSTSEIIGGGLTGALALAASDGMQVAAAAELTADALMMFGKTGADATHVADLLAQGAGAATGSARDLGMALSQVGAVANSMGLTIEDTTTSLALFAANGIKGSDAGTSLKTMLMSLANPSKKAANTMLELGINAFDASGNFVGMRDLAGQLESKLSDLSVEQRNAALATMFGSDAMRVASILTTKGAEGYDAMSKSMAGFGSAAEMAAKRTDNLKGDLAELGGSWENLMIAMGGSANGPLRDLVQGLTGLTDFAARHQTLTAVLGGTVAGVAGLAAGAIGVVRTAAALREVSAAIKSLEIAQNVTGGVKALVTELTSLRSMTSASIGLSAIAAAMVTLEALPDKAAVSTDSYGRALLAVARNAPNAKRSLDDLISSGIDNWGYRASDQIHNLADAFRGLEKTSWLGKHIGNLGKSLGQMANIKVDTRWTTLVDNVKNLDSALSTMNTKDHAAAFAHIGASAKQAGLGADQLAKHMPQTMEAMRKAAADVGVLNLSNQDLVDWMGGKVPAAVQKGAAAAKAAGKDVTALADASKMSAAASEAAAKAAKEQRDAYFDLSNVALSAVDAELGYQAALDDAAKSLKEHGRTLNMDTDAGRANWQALQNLAKAHQAVMKTRAEEGATLPELLKLGARQRADIEKMAKAYGMGTAALDAYIQKAGLTPEQIITAFSTPGLDNAKKKTTDLSAALGAVPGSVVANVSAPGAQAAIAHAQGLSAALGMVPGSTVAKVETKGADAAATKVWDLSAALGTIRSKSVTVTVRGVTTGSLAALGAAGFGMAEGGVVDYYANGGMRERHVAQIAPAGSWRVWGEPETGGEAYIPLAASKRARSLDILEEVARRFNRQVVPYAAGGVNAPAAPSGGSRLNNVQNIYGPDPQEVASRSMSMLRHELRAAAIPGGAM
ncbi:phage tail tape measure protein [Aestuariimicrobium sp. p3-SID1156]|uniref:phage tail tape measure protein n=1 Tax=Aestuariimicrobium sp. p3-SID1156 TaxID=2916038 RepID=UPI00223BC590|nr:phage tail tape measure protein [Aestuariimicrobium sp. p3-SID1156]MCT1459863.1 phage tail tape measure protein [Aestuariimicrobium sp. p3-SID1156]